MSLINDALKRAREAEQQSTEKPPPPPPLQPADHAAPPRSGGRIALTVLLVAMMAFAAFYLSRWAGNSTARPLGTASNEVAPVSVASLETVAAPATRPTAKVSTNLTAREDSVPLAESSVAPAGVSVTTSAPPAAEPGATLPETNQVARPSSPGEDAPVAVPPVAQVEVRFPELKLQSIVFRLRNPSVVIDGEMLEVGGTVKGARVVKIERHAVTVEWQGQTNILRLPQF